MILSKKDLKYYIHEDAIAIGYEKLRPFKKFVRVHFDKRIKFHIELRKYEYWFNRVNSAKWGGQNLGISYAFIPLCRL